MTGVRSSRGFTLIEILTVMAIFGMISIYVGQLLVFNERSYQQVDQATEAQQALRAISAIIERDIRHSGYMVPPMVTACGVDELNGPDTLYLTDAGAIDAQNDYLTYSGATIGGGVTAPSVGGSGVTLPLSSLVMEGAVRPAYDTDGNGTPDSDFRVGAGAIVADVSNAARGTACGTVTEVDLGAPSIKVVFRSALGAVGGAPQLIAVPANEYRLNGTNLLWNGNLLATGIEDLQVAYVFDNDGDNVIDAGEERGIGGAAYDSEDELAEFLREIRTNLVARTRLEDAEFDKGQLQRTENRSGVGVTTDGFRRRVLTTRVRLRNSGERMSVL